MDEKKLDSLITETLSEKAESLSVSPEIKKLVREKIAEGKKEENHMRHHISGKIIILAAALCLLGTMGAVAAGRVASLVSHSNYNDPAYRSYEELESNMKQDLGFTAKAAKSLAEGYDFQKASVRETEAQDDAGNVIGIFKELTVRYGASGRSELWLNVSRPSSLVNETVRMPGAVGDHEGIELSYFCDKYKFLPPGAEVSEEDKLAEERGELVISYGSDKEEINYFYTVSWNDNGIRYSIMSMDKSFTPEEMFAMAANVIDEK